MKAGEIHLGNFPFGDTPAMKLRPVLLLTGPIGPGPEFLVAYMTSVVPASLLPSDIILDPSKPEHANTGLKVVSAVRLHKLATIHDRSITRRIGSVSQPVQHEVASKLKTLLSL